MCLFLSKICSYHEIIGIIPCIFKLVGSVGVCHFSRTRVGKRNLPFSCQRINIYSAYDKCMVSSIAYDKIFKILVCSWSPQFTRINPYYYLMPFCKFYCNVINGCMFVTAHTYTMLLKQIPYF